MRFRKLRIAWSVGWSIAYLLLIVLWVRSFSRWDGIEVPMVRMNGISVSSVHGVVILDTFSERYGKQRLTSWHVYSSKLTPDIAENFVGQPTFRISLSKFVSEILFPHWVCVSIAGVLAALPWLPRRFSLRTLLIATTLVAVVLGIIVWAAT